MSSDGTDANADAANASDHAPAPASSFSPSAAASKVQGFSTLKVSFQGEMGEEEDEQSNASPDDDDDCKLDEDEDQDSDAAQDPDLCACCKEEKRVDKNIFGKECKKALNNVENREVKETGRKGERWAKWVEVKRTGGPVLNAILLAYRESCQESKGKGHKRGNFDFATHYEELRSIAKVETGEKLVYMTLVKWLKVAQEDHGYDAKQAKDLWNKKNKMLPQHKKKKERGQGVAAPNACGDLHSWVQFQ